MMFGGGGSGGGSGGASGGLFGSSRGQETSKYLVEFRAGKMTFNSSTKMVTPDKRKGTVMVHQADDQLMHFMWKDRLANKEINLPRS